MTGWRGSVFVLPLLIAQGLSAAESLDAAARELARRIAGHGHSVSPALPVRNSSDLAAQDVAEVQRALQSEWQRLGVALLNPADIRLELILSQNLSSYLLIAEVKRGDEQEVAIVSWPRPGKSLPSGQAAVSMEKTLLTEQPEPILDIAGIGDDLLILQPGRVARLGPDNGRSVAKESVSLGAISLPRDARGRLVVQGGAYLAYLPGAICSGALAPLDARCREAEEAWPISHEPPLRAYFARGRNYFDGRVIAAGPAKSVAAFYSAAAMEAPAGRLWIFARLDGRSYLHDSAFEPLAPLGGWGSDIAGLATKCGEGGLVLATRPAEGGEKDTVHVYRIVNSQAVEAAPGLDLPGPVTSLWPTGESSAIVVAHDIGSGAYAAYRLAITCGH